MARAKGKDETAPAADAVTEDSFIPEDVEFIEFVRQYDADSGGGIHVYREGPGGYRDLTFVKAFAFGEFEPPMLQQPPFNGGKFRVHVRSASGMLKNFPFRCEPANVSVEAKAATGGTDAVAPLLAGMLEGFRALSTQIAQVAQAPKGTSVEDTIKLFSLMQGMQAPRGEPVDPLAQFERFLAVQKQLAPDKAPVNADGEVDTGQIILQAMKTFGEPFAEIMKEGIAARRAHGGQVVRPLPQIPSPGATTAPPALAVVGGTAANTTTANEAAPTVTPEEEEMNLKIAMVRPVLIASARAGLDVDTYADVVLNTFSDEEINKFINGDNWREELLKVIPEAAEVMPWFESLRTEVLEGMKPEEQQGNVDGTPAGG